MSVSGLDDLYREIILDHYQSPRNQGRLAAPDVATQGSNPLCGDEIEVSLVIDDGRIADVAFQGRGCSISQASASMMTESIKGKTIAEAEELLGAFKTIMTDKNAPEADEDTLGDLEALQGVRRYPVRVKCALLAWNVLKEGLDLYETRAR
ncbi:MAG TPA: SUF system NifU family Fe-S cluster assembly protein [Chloroflexota bacterium]|nr:SUF system NifU family Fe-S cluster assembly protein [Chloroflexota bacterium]